MPKFRLIVNDREMEFESDELSISLLLEHLNIENTGIAICVNGNVVRKRDFSNYILKEGDRVDIITMVGGG
ncbi:MAG: sulfur carrier protein ThiS [Myxococcota bacterium]